MQFIPLFWEIISASNGTRGVWFKRMPWKSQIISQNDGLGQDCFVLLNCLNFFLKKILSIHSCPLFSARKAPTIRRPPKNSWSFPRVGGIRMDGFFLSRWAAGCIAGLPVLLQAMRRSQKASRGNWAEGFSCKMRLTWHQNLGSCVDRKTCRIFQEDAVGWSCVCNIFCWKK